MSGLFQKALEIRNHTQEGLEDEFVLDESSGISKEDQQEILQEIERATQESRISVSPETMAIKAVKKGFLFPLLVNILFVVLLAGGGLALYYLFQRGETGLMEEGSAIASAEGMLIEELKKESEAALQAKNKEINQIQSRLENLDKQRQELAGQPPLLVTQTMSDVAQLHARDQDWVFTNNGAHWGAWDDYFLTLEEFPEGSADALIIAADGNQCYLHSWSKPTESWQTWTNWWCANSSLGAE